MCCYCVTGACDALANKHSFSLPMKQECCLLAVDIFVKLDSNSISSDHKLFTCLAAVGDRMMQIDNSNYLCSCFTSRYQ